VKIKKKIIYIVPHLSTGGLPQYAYIKIKNIKDDYDIYVVEWNDIAPIYRVQKDRIIHLLQPNHFYSWPQGTNDNKKSKELIDIIYSINPDIIHIEEFCEWFLPTKLTNQIYSKSRTYRIVETSHNNSFNPANKKFLPDAFTFPAMIQEERFRYHRVPTTIIEYPIEENERPDRTEALTNLRLNPDYKHVLNVGLFTPGKNQGEAFEIARKLQGNKILFHFIGNQAGNFKDYWEPLMKDKPDNCIVHGERNDVEKWYGACDLLLFTSLQELNPLVPREALSWDMKVLMYDLPIYKGSYKQYGNVEFLSKDIDTNSQKVLSNLGMTTLQRRVKLPKIRLTHLLTRPNDEREVESIKSLSPLKNLGIDYIQHINEPETEYPEYLPLTHHAVKRPGYYGAYKAFRRAIEEEFTTDLDFFMICECDCILTISPEHFTEALSQVCKSVEDNDIYYFSFGSTGEGNVVWSDKIEELNEFSFLTNKIILAHCILFPQKARSFLLQRYKELSWDSPDIWFNEAFMGKKRMAILNHPLAEQHKGMSLIDSDEYKGTIQTFDLPNKGMRELLIDVYENVTIEHRDALSLPNTYNFNFIKGVFLEVKGEKEEESNNTYYQKIDGFFDFEDIYKSTVNEFDNAHFVEVGAWLGKSACYMATEIKNSDKNIQFDVIDNWKGNTEHQEMTKGNRDIQEEFLINMRNAGVSGYVNDITLDSINASTLYVDDTLDFVFIDGNHEDLMNDIKVWYPKVKDGGIIGGHDYSNGWPQVVKDVNEYFGNDKTIINVSWLHRKNRKGPIILYDNRYLMEMIDTKTNQVIHHDKVYINHWTRANRKWYTEWSLRVSKNGKTVFEHKFNLKDKRVYISLESKSLGDTIAWMPYVEEFRKKHDCIVYCSTFWNNLWDKELYSDIQFVMPGTTVDNLYAMYVVVYSSPFDGHINPRNPVSIPLQTIASDILGLPQKEIKPFIELPEKEPKIKEKYVCFSIHSTAQCKYWNYPGGWQKVVDYLKKLGYKVVNIAKENQFMGNKPPTAKDIINRTGDKYNIRHRINELQHADMFIGVSSGLAWLAWAIGIPTIIISGNTKPFNEPDVYRPFNNNVCNGCLNNTNFIFDKGKWNWCPENKNFECSKSITPEMVIDDINTILNIKEQSAWNNPDMWTEKGDEWSKSFGNSETLWKEVLYPKLNRFLSGDVLEIAPGQGRITQFLIPLSSRLDIVDMNQYCLDSCRERFSGINTIHYHKNDGKSLNSITNASKDFVISWDSFVHMNLQVIEQYISEISKKLKPEGHGFIHHSNLQGGEEKSFKNIGGRSNMSPPIFKEICERYGLRVLTSWISH